MDWYFNFLEINYNYINLKESHNPLSIIYFLLEYGTAFHHASADRLLNILLDTVISIFLYFKILNYFQDFESS